MEDLQGLMVPGADKVDRIAAVRRHNRNSEKARPFSFPEYIKSCIVPYLSEITLIPR